MLCLGVDFQGSPHGTFTAWHPGMCQVVEQTAQSGNFDSEGSAMLTASAMHRLSKACDDESPWGNCLGPSPLCTKAGTTRGSIDRAVWFDFPAWVFSCAVDRLPEAPVQPRKWGVYDLVGIAALELPLISPTPPCTVRDLPAPLKAYTSACGIPAFGWKPSPTTCPYINARYLSMLIYPGEGARAICFRFDDGRNIDAGRVSVCDSGFQASAGVQVRRHAIVGWGAFTCPSCTITEPTAGLG